MNVLILGSGGREHTLAWKMNQSKLLEKLFIAPGNAGTAEFGTNINLKIDNFIDIKNFVLEHYIQLVIVGPELPLVKGIADFFQKDEELAKVGVIGPCLAGAMLEGSKEYAKQFMLRHAIPTASYRSFDKKNYVEALAWLKMLKPPFVLKADGLASGKGVIICHDLEEADKLVKDIIVNKRFGDAGNTLVIEEFLSGIEVSMFVLTDGNDYLLLPEAKDYKRIGEGDTGLNTGGMGNVSPVPFVDKLFLSKVEERIIKPTIAGLKKENINYKGFIFFGLMNVNGNPYVIEYNVRLGDPETEVIIPRIQSDLLEIFAAVKKGELSKCQIMLLEQHAVTIILSSKGYPEKFETGKEIIVDEKISDCLVFHAGTVIEDKSGKLLTNGGRVLAVTALGKNLQEAIKMAYTATEKISFEGKYFRKDIGKDLLKF